MMDYETQRVIREWNMDVNEVMRDLIREGTPPFDAAGQARDIISRRRRRRVKEAADGQG